MIKIGKMFPFVMGMMFTKPATVKYPYFKPEVVKNFRGKLKFEQDKCIGCKICMRDCPSKAINIETVGEKVFKADVKLDRCLYCAQCVESCPKDALSCTTNFELANFTRESLRVDI